MRPIRILIFAATTVLSTLAGYALLTPVRPIVSSIPHVTTSASIPTRAEEPIIATFQEVARPQVATPVVPTAPRVITDIQYVDAPVQKSSLRTSNPERGVEHAEQENEHDD
jgi:hypothetical protein